MFGDTTPSELPDKWAMSVRQPIGVAGIITPWNFPIAIPCWKTMPALVTGNTVVFKPASDTPHCATLLVELMAEAGFPPGTVNLVTGPGPEVGDAIVDSPDVPVISLHRQHGDRHGASPSWPARRLKRLSLELGGKNGIVVLADADLDLATDGHPLVRLRDDRPALHGLLAGHRRGDGRRAAPRAPRAAGAGSSGSATGSSRRPTSGRSSTRRPSRRSSAYVEIGRREGELVTGGARATGAGLEHGHFFEPTIFAGVKPMDRIAQEEIFGPVLSVIPVPDYPAAVTALNQTRYGLSSSIFTQRRRTPRSGRCATSRPGSSTSTPARSAPRRTCPFGGIEADRQRPPRGRPRGARHVHRVEVDLRRLLGPAPEGPDRQPARLSPGRPGMQYHPRGPVAQRQSKCLLSTRLRVRNLARLTILPSPR